MEIIIGFTMLNHFPGLVVNNICLKASFFEGGERGKRYQGGVRFKQQLVEDYHNRTYILTSLSQASINYDCFQVRREVNARQTKRSNPPKQVSHFSR